MISASKYAVFLLLVLATTGCIFNQKKAKSAPQQAQAPTITTGQTPTPLPTLEPEAPAATPLPATTNEQPVTPPQPAKKKRTSIHKPKAPAVKPAETALAPNATGTPADPGKSAVANTPPATPDAAPTQVASAAPPANVSSIGELSTGDVATGSQTRRETLDTITNTENGLNGIKRSLSSQEQETVSQIRSFLTKARQALGVDDIDGAKTLATKAKVLLDELIKQ